MSPVEANNGSSDKNKQDVGGMTEPQNIKHLHVFDVPPKAID